MERPDELLPGPAVERPGQIRSAPAMPPPEAMEVVAAPYGATSLRLQALEIISSILNNPQPELAAVRESLRRHVEEDRWHPEKALLKHLEGRLGYRPAPSGLGWEPCSHHPRPAPPPPPE